MTDRNSSKIGYYSSHPSLTKSEVETGIRIGDINEADVVVAEEYREESFDEDLIPDPSSDQEDDPARAERWATEDSILDQWTLQDAYRMYCDKTPIVPGRKSQLLSCPNPEHPDRHPSANFTWEANGNDGLFYCHSCGVAAGNKYHLAALAFGYSPDDIKGVGNKTFRVVKMRILEDLGYTASTTNPKGERLYRKVEAQNPEPEEPIEKVEPTDNVIQLVPPASDDPPPPQAHLEWRSIVQPGTPLDVWMEALRITSIPDEFLFWQGLQALALAAGRNVYIPSTPNIYSNIYVLNFAGTGAGKSRSIGQLEVLLTAAMPFEGDAEASRGVLVKNDAASGEGAINAHAPVIDTVETPDDPRARKSVSRASRVKTFWHIDEFHTLMGKKGRNASMPIDKAFIMLYDNKLFVSNDKSDEKATVVAHEPFCVVASTAQPGAIRDYVHRNDIWSGFMNRWVPAIGTRKTRPRREPIADLSNAIHAFEHLATGWASHEHRIQMDDDALNVWHNFLATEIDIYLKNSEQGNLQADALMRTELLMQKICLLLCINERKESIDVELLNKALSLWPYIRDCYLTIIGKVSTGSDRDRALEWLEDLFAQEPEISKSRLGELKRANSHEISPSLVEDWINVWRRVGKLEEDKRAAKKGANGKAGGRKITVYRLMD